MYQSLRCTVGPQKISKTAKMAKQQKIYPPVVLNQEYAPLEVKNDNLVTVGKSDYVPVIRCTAGPQKIPKTAKNVKKT